MVEKLYRSCFRCAVEDCRLTPNEIAVLLFLGRNAPGRDTATDIAQSCGISKALVARSVSGLHRRGFFGLRTGSGRPQDGSFASARGRPRGSRAAGTERPPYCGGAASGDPPGGIAACAANHAKNAGKLGCPARTTGRLGELYGGTG